MGLDAMILVFWKLSFKLAFSPSSFIIVISYTLIQNKQFKAWEKTKQKDDVQYSVKKSKAGVSRSEYSFSYVSVSYCGSNKLTQTYQTWIFIRRTDAEAEAPIL